MKTLPELPEPHIHKSLQRAKLLLTHALKHSQQNTDLDHMIALHGLDNVVEYILKAIYEHIDFESISEKSILNSGLSEFAGSINQCLRKNFSSKLSYLSEIKTLRQMRNMVQHGNLNPNTDLPRYCIIVERFFNKCLEEIFNLPNGEVYSSQLIEDSVIKKQINAAEKHIEANHYLEAIISLRNAFENAVHKKTRHSDIVNSIVPWIMENQKETSHSYYFTELIQNELLASKLGINNEDYDYFKRYLDYIPLDRTLGATSSRLLTREWTKEDVQFCYGFVISTCLLWQETTRPEIEQYDSEEFSYTERIGDITYCMEDALFSIGDEHDQTIEFLCVEDNKPFEALEIGATYRHEYRSFKNGRQDHYNSQDIRFLQLYSKPLTNEPVRWLVAIKYEIIDAKPEGKST